MPAVPKPPIITVAPSWMSATAACTEATILSIIAASLPFRFRRRSYALYASAGVPTWPPRNSRLRSGSSAARDAGRSSASRPISSTSARLAYLSARAHVLLDHQHGGARVGQRAQQRASRPARASATARSTARRSAARAGAAAARGRPRAASARRRTASTPGCRSARGCAESARAPRRCAPRSSPRGSVMPPSSRLWRTESEPNRLRPCGTNAMPSASRSRGAVPLMRRPSKRISPARGVSMPNSVFSTRRLAGAVRADQQRDLAGARIERRLVQDREARRVAGDDVLEFDDRPGSCRARPSGFSCQDTPPAPARFDCTLGRRALGEHPALDHADDVRAEPHDEVHVVLDHDEAAALRPVELEQQFAQLLDEAGIDARRTARRAAPAAAPA